MFKSSIKYNSATFLLIVRVLQACIKVLVKIMRSPQTKVYLKEFANKENIRERTAFGKKSSFAKREVSLEIEKVN